MKTLIPFVLLTVVGCATHAQPRTAIIAPPPPPDEDVVIVAQAPEPAKARKTPGAPAALSATPAPPNELNLLNGAHGASIAWSGSSSKSFGFGGASAGSRRTIVIPKADASPEFLADAEEDLNVMTLILEKAVDARSEDEGKKALGIDIFSSSSGIRNLLIEGHGAIFALKTKIALVPPPAPKKEETKTKETTSSEWEEAKRQIYGPSEIEKELNKAFKHVQNSFNSNEDYDAQKVQRLKDSLVEALKSASNIRHLSGDQTVTVVVLSSSAIGDVRRIVTSAGRAGSSDQRRAEVYAKADREAYASDGRSGSRLMLQAKKSDIDSYARGKLTTDAFRDKVRIQIY